MRDLKNNTALTEEQKQELSQIKRVVRQHHHDGVSVVSGFVSKDCGCYLHSSLYKTIVVGLPSDFLSLHTLPGAVHQIMPCENQRCAKDRKECLETHKGVTNAVNNLLQALMMNRYHKTRHPIRKAENDES